MNRKIAVILVGSHYSGKSKTISKYLKGMLNISNKTRITILRKHKLYIKSQSLEEANGSIDNWIIIWQEYELLVIACRPERENPSYLKIIKEKLEENNFQVNPIEIVKQEKNEKYYENKAKEILTILSKIDGE